MQDLIHEVYRVKYKLIERNENISSIMTRGFRDEIDHETTAHKSSTKFNFVENAFQEGGAIKGITNDEEEVYSRTTYSNMYSGGQPQSMTVIDECSSPYAAALGIDAVPKDPITYRIRLKILYVSLITAFISILIANIALLLRVRFSLFTIEALMVNPLSILIAAILKRYSFI